MKAKPLVLGLATVLLSVAATQPAPRGKLQKADNTSILRSAKRVEPGATVLPASEDAGVESQVNAFKEARKATKLEFKQGLSLTIMAAGPRLDGKIAGATVERFEVKDNTFTMVVDYATAGLGEETTTLHNMWTPVACAPIQAPAGGVYKVKVTWKNVSVPEGRKNRPADLVQETTFTIK